MKEPPVKKILYWCDRCNIPLIGRSCACGNQGFPIPLLEPYDVRPALAADRELITRLIRERFGTITIPKVLLLNKAGGLDRNDLVIANGTRFGWLTFDPVRKKFIFDLSPEAIRFIVPQVTRGVLDLETSADIPEDRDKRGRIGGKKFRAGSDGPDGTLIVKYRGKYGTGVLTDGWIRVKEILPMTPVTPPDPGWDEVIEKNRYHLKNLERNALRTIKQYIGKRPVINVSFSGGKDSTAVLLLAKKAGVKDAFFIDTGIEFPETLGFVRSMGVEIVGGSSDFWAAATKAGPPAKDNRWCCKLQKQNPLRLYLAKTGPCVTLQGNRWYESWNRADLELAVNNPLNPLQLNISPIRNWRALEVFLYLWWQKAPENPLYELGFERIGCYPCPSMLESEFAGLRQLHPDLASRWSDILTIWADKKGLPQEYVDFGLWRWKSLPKKMQQLCRDHGIGLIESPDGVTVKAEPGRKQLHSPAAVLPTKVPVPSGERVVRPDGTGQVRQHQLQTANGNGGDTFTIETTECQPAGTPGDHPGRQGFDRIRQDFSLLTEVVYLDNASMSLSPEPVITAMLEYERNYRALAITGSHRLAGITGQRYWHAHEKVEKFIGGGKDGVTVFTKNLTGAMEIIRKGIPWQAGDRVLLSLLEPAISLLSWEYPVPQDLSPGILGISNDYTPDLERLRDVTQSGNIRLVIVSHVSDIFGSVAPLDKITRICHENGAYVLVDGSQSVSRMPVDVSAPGMDFFCFSGHTMLGPTGTGVLWIRDPDTLPLIPHGSSGADSRSRHEHATTRAYELFEPGTPHIAGSIGLGAAVDYLSRIGMDRVRYHDSALTERLISGLSGIEGITVFAPAEPIQRIGNVAFTVRGMEPDDVGRYLDDQADVLVATGTADHAPLMESLGFPGGMIRAGISLYNNENDIDTLIAAVGEISRGV